MATKTQAHATIHTGETLMKELIDASKTFERIFNRLVRTEPTSEKYFELLGDLWAGAELIETKAADCKEVADELMDAFPG